MVGPWQGKSDGENVFHNPYSTITGGNSIVAAHTTTQPPATTHTTGAALETSLSDRPTTRHGVQMVVGGLRRGPRR